MSEVCICGGCGRTIEKEFLYCPWCGKSKIQALQENTNYDEVFNQLEQMQQNSRLEKIKQMGDRLQDLEKELDTLVLSAEMHK